MVVAQREGVLERSCKFLFFTFLAVCSLTCQYASASSPTRVKRIIVSDEIYQPQIVNKVAKTWCDMNTFANLVIGQSTGDEYLQLKEKVKGISEVMLDERKLCRVLYDGFLCGVSKTTELYFDEDGFVIGSSEEATKVLACLSDSIKTIDVIEELIAGGADIQSGYCALGGLASNLTVVYQAVSSENEVLLKTLLKRDANPNVLMRVSIDCKPSGTELSPINNAIAGKNAEIVSLLLEAGVKIPEKGIYSMMFEVPIVWLPVLQNKNDGAPVLDVLLKHGANIQHKYDGEFLFQLTEKQTVQKTERTETLLEFAKRHGYNDVVKVIEKYENQNEAIPETKKDERLFRYKQCELENTPEYCDCLIGHVSKAIGWIDEMVWLSGGALTDASGRQALVQAGFLCAGLNKKTPTYQEQKAQEETGMFNGGKYKVSDLKFCDGIFGRAVCGVIENLTGQQQDVLLVYVNLYDADNIRVGEGMANINTVAPHEKIRFETVGDIDDSVVSFKVREIMD